MKIIEVSRLISGPNIDNVRATAQLTDKDDPVKAILKLDQMLKKALDEIANCHLQSFQGDDVPF